LDTFPLINFFSFLGVKYALGIIVLSIIFSVAADFLLASGPTSPSMAIAGPFAFSAMLFLLAFIVFIMYKLYMGERFQFMPLAASASIIIFAFTLLVTVRTVLTDSSGFHVVQVFLALVGSLAMGAVFSALVKVAQRFISA
jgi:hypothetical protein